MPESPLWRFHICLPLNGEVVALCGEPDPKYIINAAYPFNFNSEFICAKCLKSYQEIGR